MSRLGCHNRKSDARRKATQPVLAIVAHNQADCMNISHGDLLSPVGMDTALSSKSSRFNDPVGGVFKARMIRPWLLPKRHKRFAAH